MIEWIKRAASRNISGSYNFYIKSQPQYPDITTTLTITTWTDKSETAMLPCHYKWYRIRNGITQQSSKFKGNSYVCDPTDIGAVIQAQAISNDHEYSGKALVEFGPIKLSIQTKKHIIDTLVFGSTTIPVNISINDIEQKQCNIKIMQELIKIYKNQQQINYTFTFSSNQPKIQIISRDQLKIKICFLYGNQKEFFGFIHHLFGGGVKQGKCYSKNQWYLDVKFANKQQRDCFLFAIKAFTIRKQLKNSMVINRLQQKVASQNEEINQLLQIQSLKLDIHKLLQINQQKQKLILELNKQIQKLQKQIQDIINIYQQNQGSKYGHNADFNTSYQHGRSKKDSVFINKYQTLEKQNFNLNQKIKSLTVQVQQIRINSDKCNKNQTIINPTLTHNSIIPVNELIERDDISFESILQSLSSPKQKKEESSELKKKLQKINDEKITLQKKLQRSFKMIQNLQKKLKNNQTTSSYSSKNTSDIQNNNKNILNYEIQLDLQRLQKQCQRLQQINQNFKKQNKFLQKQLNKFKNQYKQSHQNNHLNNSKVIQKYTLLKYQNQKNKEQILKLKNQLNYQINKNDKLYKDKIILQKKIQELIKQINLYKVNQEVLNRSQNLSMQMDTYNQQQIRVLRQQNDFLLNQNQKLSKAVQKYMCDARQSIKLRKQILQLKQKHQQLVLNPQKSYSKNDLSQSRNNILLPLMDQINENSM